MKDLSRKLNEIIKIQADSINEMDELNELLKLPSEGYLKAIRDMFNGVLDNHYGLTSVFSDGDVDSSPSTDYSNKSGESESKLIKTKIDVDLKSFPPDSSESGSVEDFSQNCFTLTATDEGKFRSKFKINFSTVDGATDSIQDYQEDLHMNLNASAKFLPSIGSNVIKDLLLQPVTQASHLHS